MGLGRKASGLGVWAWGPACPSTAGPQKHDPTMFCSGSCGLASRISSSGLED